MYKNLVATLVAACAFSVAISSHAAAPTAAVTAKADPLKVGFVYVTPVLPAGWTRQHDEGRVAMEKALPGQVKSTVVADVPEGADEGGNVELRLERLLAADGSALERVPGSGRRVWLALPAGANPSQPCFIARFL